MFILAHGFRCSSLWLGGPSLLGVVDGNGGEQSKLLTPWLGSKRQRRDHGPIIPFKGTPLINKGLPTWLHLLKHHPPPPKIIILGTKPLTHGPLEGHSTSKVLALSSCARSLGQFLLLTKPVQEEAEGRQATATRREVPIHPRRMDSLGGWLSATSSQEKLSLPLWLHRLSTGVC
jgi:hypothetical protein